MWEYMKNNQPSPTLSLLLTNDFPPIVSGISTLLYQLYVRQKSDEVKVMTAATKGDEQTDKQTAIPVVRVRLTTG